MPCFNPVLARGTIGSVKRAIGQHDVVLFPSGDGRWEVGSDVAQAYAPIQLEGAITLNTQDWSESNFDGSYSVRNALYESMAEEADD